MSTRRRAREIVLQLLYEADINPSRDADSARAFIRSRLQGRKALTDFANALLATFGPCGHGRSFCRGPSQDRVRRACAS